MKSIYLLLLVTLPFILCQNYVVPDLDYDKTDPTCANINSLISATSDDMSRFRHYVSVTLPERSSKLNDIYASVKKTCQISQLKRPSLIQTSKLRAENVKTLEKLRSQVKSITKSLGLGKESPKMFRSLVHLNMKSVAPSDLCSDVYEAIINLKNYLKFLIPAITETYIDGKLADRLNKLQSFNAQCTAAACDDSDQEKEAVHRHWEEEEAAWHHHVEEEEAYRHHEEEEAAYRHWEEEEAAYRHHEEEEEAAYRHWEEEEAAYHHWEEEEAIYRHHEEEEAAYRHWEEEEAAYRHWEEEEAAWHHHVEEEEAAAAAAAEAAAEAAAHGSDSIYTFYPTYDSDGGDITLLQGYSVRKLKAWCTANSDCLGFNDNGYVKSKIKTKDEWNQWTVDPTVGFYLKKNAPVDYYLFYPNKDLGGSDITQLKGYTVADLKTQCSSRSNCQGFNTDGWLKNTVKTLKDWSSNSGVNWGFYVRLSDFPTKYDYTSYIYKDSAGNDLIQLKGVSVEDLRTYCDANSACVGFNTDGWIKSVVKPTSQWNSNTDTANWAWYVKGGVSAKQYNTEIDHYHFYPLQDSAGNDITHLKGYTMDALKAECDKRSNCVGFNTEGWLKNTVKPLNNWNADTSKANWGFYVKETTTPKIHEYASYVNKDSAGNDLIRLQSISVEDLKAACDANSACVGFNTDGWLKSVVKATSQWNSDTSKPNWTWYVKQ